MIGTENSREWSEMVWFGGLYGEEKMVMYVVCKRLDFFPLVIHIIVEFAIQANKTRLNEHYLVKIIIIGKTNYKYTIII